MSEKQDVYTRVTNKIISDLERGNLTWLQPWQSGHAAGEISRPLRAIGAAFLCADLGITPEIREDHAAYVASWLKVLKNDKRAIFTAASHAQRAADHLHTYQAGA